MGCTTSGTAKAELHLRFGKRLLELRKSIYDCDMPDLTFEIGCRSDIPKNLLTKA